MKYIIAIGIAMLATAAAADDEVAIDARMCGTSEVTTIDRADELRIGTSEVRGIMQSTQPGGFGDHMTVYCRSLWTISKSVYEFSNRCTNVDSDGDRYFTMANGTSIKSFSWKLVAGTGKYAGISGGGEGALEQYYPKIKPELGGACFKVTGKGRLAPRPAKH